MTFLRSLLTLLRAPIAIASVTPVALRPDDVIVVHVAEKRLSAHQVDLLRQQFTQVWPRQKVMILDAGMSLEVMQAPPPAGTLTAHPPAELPQNAYHVGQMVRRAPDGAA